MKEQFVKFGLTQDALRSHVHLIAGEVQDYTKKEQKFKGKKGSFEVVGTMSEVVLYTASRSLQGKEVREKLNVEFAEYFHDLDMGFSPINFMLPWAPLPHNRKRDIAHQKMIDTYTEIIQSRRKAGTPKDSEDMIWNLMSCKYKDGTPIPDHEAAGMMIALLMGGQHSSSSTISWILLHLAAREDLQEELFQEQKEVLGKDLPEMTYDDIPRLKLHSACTKETLRIHTPIHSIMRKVTRPMPVESTPYTIPAGHVLLSSPGYSAKSEEHFPNADSWEPHRWDDGMNQKNDEDEEKVDWGYGMVSKGSNSPYLPFGAGRHRCIGEQFAYVQLTTILAMLVREFKFRGVGGSKQIVETDYSVSLKAVCGCSKMLTLSAVNVLKTAASSDHRVGKEESISARVAACGLVLRLGRHLKMLFFCRRCIYRRA